MEFCYRVALVVRQGGSQLFSLFFKEIFHTPDKITITLSELFSDVFDLFACFLDVLRVFSSFK